MADPATIALVVGATASVAGGISAMQQGKAQAKALGQQAERQKEAGELEAARKRREARFLQGAQAARFAKAGVDITGTPLQVMEETAKQQELDAMLLRFGGDIAATRTKSEGELAKRRGTSGLIKGLGSGATILSGIK